MQFCKAPGFAVRTSCFFSHFFLILPPRLSLSLMALCAFLFLLALVVFLIFKAPWPQNRCFSDKFPESSGRARQAESGEESGKGSGKKDRERTGSVWGIGQRGRGENEKRTGEKGRARRKNKSGNGNRGGGQKGRKEAPVFLRNFSCEPLRQRGVRGESPHGSPDFFRKFFRQLSAPLLRPEFCSRWEWRDRK